jgi:hypothetical protein
MATWPPAGTLRPPPGLLGHRLRVDQQTALSPAGAVVVGGDAAPRMPSAAPERGESVLAFGDDPAQTTLDGARLGLSCSPP